MKIHSKMNPFLIIRKERIFSTQFKWVHIIFVEEPYHLPNVTAYVYLGEAKGNLEI